MKKALIVWGGWDGHTPDACADVFKPALEKRDYTVDVSDTLDAFNDAEKLNTYDVIIPIWTMGEMTGDQLKNLTGAVASGVGFAGGCGPAGADRRDRGGAGLSRRQQASGRVTERGCLRGGVVRTS